MDSRDRYGYNYSTRQAPAPPIYTIEERRPEYKYVKRRDLTVSESSYSSDDRRYTVEYPPDGGQWAWIVVLACAVLHICNELVYFIFYDTIVIANFRNTRLAVPKDTYTEFMVFEDIRIAGEIVAALASVFIGYRVVAAFGSVLVGVGFLAASFVTPSEEIELMGFLVGFMGGLGCSFWRFAAYVAVMEYFKKHRMTALILSGFGRVIGIFIGYAIVASPVEKVWDTATSQVDIDDMIEWETYYRLQLIPVCIAFIACLVIKPLALVKSRRPGDLSWFLRIRSTRVCRSGMLLVVLGVYFLYYLGESLPNTLLLYWMRSEGFSTGSALGTVFALAGGVFGGYILLAFWPLNKKLYGSVLWMGTLCLLLGLVTLQMPVFTSTNTIYVVPYAVIIGGAQVMFETILRYVIPIGFGRQYIRWIEGLLGLMGGCALIANNFIADELAKKSPGYSENLYYFAGSAFLAAGLLAVSMIQLAMCIKLTDRNHDPDHLPGPVEYVKDRNHSRRSTRRRDESPPRYYHGYQYR